MRDLGRIQNDQQFWITRGQLAALAVTTLAVAALAFFVGVMVGQDDVPLPAGLGPDAALVDAELRDDAITELLARVETAASSRIPEAKARAPERELTFPQDLVAEVPEVEVPAVAEAELVPLDELTLEPIELSIEDLPIEPIVEDEPEAEPEPEIAPVVVAPEPAAVIEAPPAPPEGLPMDGYVIQVYSFPDAVEAKRKVEWLESKGFPAYRVAAIVGGRTWHRVRIGPYDTQSEARRAIPQVSAELGVADPLVTKAP
ncbi:MAG: SPOR domain-containing protein [Proteobacteria bacterium]|nr:SPOR domain-containing protein [Pseudomonadota bacterium]MCP4916064.1 SPOR domain-containing protein [Pseudomonadota bacterium]